MAKIRMVTLEKLLEMKANDESFTLVETLSEEAYKEGHIPGAINIPSDRIVRLAQDQLDKGETVVTYCADYACKASTIAAAKLIDTGFEDVLDFKGGKKLWVDAGLELEQ